MAYTVTHFMDSIGVSFWPQWNYEDRRENYFDFKQHVWSPIDEMLTAPVFVRCEHCWSMSKSWPGHDCPFCGRKIEGYYCKIKRPKNAEEMIKRLDADLKPAMDANAERLLGKNLIHQWREDLG